jgi:hypothetical protein
MRFFYVLAIMLLACHHISLAQTIYIKGQVKAKDKAPVQGASVMIKGSSTGTSTDRDGMFSLPASKLPVKLVFSAVGYNTKELVIKKTDSAKFIAVKLDESEYELAEVVVVGYGSEKKMDISGSTTVISGRASGLEVTGKTATGPARANPSRGISVTDIDRTSPGGPGANAKMLTAGELSDFKKWNLWGGYTKSEFRIWSLHWGISPVNRYCLQVQNEDRKAITGEKAFLINLKTNDTVWRAVTDNTGKAELWANFNVADSAQSTYAIICGGKMHRSPTSFENGINRITLKKNCDRSNTVNIAFVVDATGSMGDEISYMQEELQDVISNVSAKNKDVDLSIGSVFYRDYTDDYVTRAIDFQSNPSSLLQFIKNQTAGGGGDYPEAVDAALTTALDSLRWDNNARAKIIFLILDAPPHDQSKDKMKNIMVQAAAMGVRIVPVVCSGVDKPTEYIMRSLALATNGSYVFLTDDSGVGDKHIKPTTDNFKVELLNDLFQRVIAEMIYMEPCNDKEIVAAPADTETNHAKVVVYPNPSAGKINISSSEYIKELYITDFAGKILERINTGNKTVTWQVNLGNYPSGTYLVSYFAEKKGWGTKKVLLVK